MRFIALLISFISLPIFAHAQTVDIIYESGTYTPPFYQGLPLWSRQSEITFTAIMTGVANPKSLYYLWSRDGTVLGLVSGQGRDTLSFFDAIFSKPKTIKVEVSTPSEEILAEASITLTPREPELLVYENNPLYGYMFHKEVGESHQMQGEEVTFTAFPLFFSALSRDYPIKYSWGESSITYRVPEGGGGTASSLIEAANPEFIRQTARKSFTIKFSQADE